MVKTGILLASTAGKLPVFTKRRVKHRQYRGLYGVVAWHRVGPNFDAMVARSGRSPSSVSVAIELAQ